MPDEVPPPSDPAALPVPAAAPEQIAALLVPPRPPFASDEDDAAHPPEAAPPAEEPLADPAPPAIPLAVLVEVNGPGDGLGTPITSAGARIGRNEPELTLDLIGDPWVSRLHARLDFHDDHWWLADAGSKNGTWLERVQVTSEVPIAPGQILRVGHTELLFSDDPHLVTPAPHHS